MASKIFDNRKFYPTDRLCTPLNNLMIVIGGMALGMAAIHGSDRVNQNKTAARLNCAQIRFRRGG